MSGYRPLKEEADRRGRELQALRGAHSPTLAQGCSAYAALAGAMHKMLKFIDDNGARCQFPAEVGQIKQQYGNLDEMRKTLCDFAQRERMRREQRQRDILRDWRPREPPLPWFPLQQHVQGIPARPGVYGIRVDGGVCSGDG